MTDWLTLQEAAQQLGISPRTARRWIREGRLEAEMRQGPYGPQYFIASSQIQTAQQITDVVRVERQVDMTTLAKALSSYLEEREDALAQALESLRVEYKQAVQGQEQQALTMQKEIEELRLELAARDERQQRRDAELLQEVALQHQQTAASLGVLAGSQSENQEKTLQNFRKELTATIREQEEKRLQIAERDREVIAAIKASLERKKRRWPWQR